MRSNKSKFIPKERLYVSNRLSKHKVKSKPRPEHSE